MSFRVVFANRPFTIMWAGRLLNHVANLMQSVTIGWWVYSLARMTHDERASAFLVGMVGLVQFLPMFALALIAGETADRYDRRKIMFRCAMLQSFCAACFILISVQDQPSLKSVFAVACFFGVARAFAMPAGTSLLPALVPCEILPKAIAWNTLAVQGGMVVGPMLGGYLSGLSITAAHVVALVLFSLSSLSSLTLLRMPINAKPQHSGASRLTMIREGLIHLRDSKIVLGAISLDLCAVFLGGVTSLLPVYAKDILHIGSEGFGQLRAAVALGGGVMTLVLATRPIARHAGKWMLGGVAIYGVATIGFAVSETFWLSMIMLVIAGAADSVSVSVRQNLVQIVTPDHMRGRVSAVSGLFISASNELGEFESGVAARLFGVVGSALFGGVGSIAVTALWTRLFPALRKADRIAPPEL